MIVDDQFIVRSGLSSFITIYPDLAFVGEADNGADAVRICGELRPDIILMDLIMPKLNGVEATRQIIQQYPDTKILVLTSFKEDDLVEQVLQAGAIGYILKDISADELVMAIRNVYAGRPTLAPEAMRALLKPHPPVVTLPFGEALTPREREVLELMIEGLSNPQIADRLILSLSTVKFHVSSILSKFQATTRTEAVTLALKAKATPR
ncbi:MAG: response regulator transcription factor [Caldilineaceae bacterium]|nr:response regulator transcription factor [Caldilineaceae bacterium]